MSVLVIGCWLNNSSYRHHKNYCFAAFIFLSVLPSLCRWIGISYFRYSIFPMAESLILFPVFGYCIIKWDIQVRYKRQLYILGVIAAILHIVLLYYSIVYLKDSHKFQNVEEPTSIFMAISVFVWFSNQEWGSIIDKNHIRPDTIARLSNCSLGIFLVQAAIFMVSQKFGLPFHNPYFGAFLTYIVSLFLVLQMKKLPLLRLMVP